MQKYIEWDIVEVKEVAKETTEIWIKPSKNINVNFEPGQFLTVLFDLDGEEIRRGYSIASSPHELPIVHLAIKRQSDGFASTHLLDQLKKGEKIKTLPPLGNFTVVTNPENKNNYIMIGAGSGITPLMAMIKAVLNNEPKSKVLLVYGNHDEDSIIFKTDIERLQNKHSNFSVIHTLSNANNNWKGETGRISKEQLIVFIKDFLEESEKGEYYICGPTGMMQTAFESLEELNVSKNQIHREIYNTKVVEDDEEIDEVTREVTIILEGEKYKITVEPDESILEKALSEGLPVPNSCQYGSCGTCRAELLSGKLKLVDQSVLSEEEIEQGYCLTCVGYPLTDNVVILYEDRF